MIPTPARRRDHHAGGTTIFRPKTDSLEATVEDIEASRPLSERPREPSELQCRLPTPRPSTATSTSKPLAAGQCAPLSSRATATENLGQQAVVASIASSCAWQTGSDANTNSPSQAPPKIPQVATSRTSGGGSGNATSQNISASQVPDPLVELTHVIQMVTGKPTQANTGSSIVTSTKTRPASVAAELLMSSALRMQWPTDRRKVATSDAAVTCRDAAAVLHEAAQQLLAVANGLGNGPCTSSLHDVKVVGAGAASSIESRRRRTFGGALSPPVQGGGAQRSSPPMRLSGLRV